MSIRDRLASLRERLSPSTSSADGVAEHERDARIVAWLEQESARLEQQSVGGDYSRPPEPAVVEQSVDETPWWADPVRAKLGPPQDESVELDEVAMKAAGRADELRESYFSAMTFENTPIGFYDDEGDMDEFPDSSDSVRLEQALLDHLRANPALRGMPKWADWYEGVDEQDVVGAPEVENRAPGTPEVPGAPGGTSPGGDDRASEAETGRAQWAPDESGSGGRPDAPTDGRPPEPPADPWAGGAEMRLSAANYHAPEAAGLVDDQSPTRNRPDWWSQPESFSSAAEDGGRADGGWAR